MISFVTSNGLDHTVSYDNAGNETGYFATRSYSPRNLMNAVIDTAGEGTAHQINYGYDYRGIRVSRTESPTDSGSASRYYFYTPELQLLASTVDDSNNVWSQSTHHILSSPLSMNREIVWFNGAPVAEIGPPRTPDPDPLTTLSHHRTLDTGTATNTFYTFTDHLGTPLMQTDTTGAIVWRAEHEPYGNVYLMRKGARTDQPLRFPGQELAMTWEGTEENYNVFRWYQGGWGRYTQPDPLGIGGRGVDLPGGDRRRFSLRIFEASRSRSGNGASAQTLFAYADNEPLRRVDPLGLMDFVWDCVAQAISPISTTMPRDPQSLAKGVDAVCNYEVKCDMYDSYFGVVLKVEGLWRRNMNLPPGQRCSCPKYCQFQLIGLPQTITGQGQTINLFAPTSFTCGESLRPFAGPYI